MEVSLDVSGVDLTAEGRVARESADVGEGRTGRTLYAALEPAPGLRPGDFVRVSVVEPPLAEVALLPATAVGADGTVLVLGAEDRLEVAEVELMRRQGDDVLVRAADLAGREVVAERSPLLGPGIKVSPVRPEAEPTPAAVEPAADDAGALAVPEVQPAVVRAGAPATIALTAERRARLRAFVEASAAMPPEAKARTLAELDRAEVPAATVERLERRMDG